MFLKHTIQCSGSIIFLWASRVSEQLPKLLSFLREIEYKITSQAFRFDLKEAFGTLGHQNLEKNDKFCREEKMSKIIRIFLSDRSY